MINTSTVTRGPSDSLSTKPQNHRAPKRPLAAQTFLARHLATGTAPNEPLVYALSSDENDRNRMPSHPTQKIGVLHRLSPKTAQNAVFAIL